MKTEMLESKKFANEDLMNQVTTKVNHLGFCIVVANKSIKMAANKNEAINESVLEQKALMMISSFVQALTFISLKKHGTTLPAHILAKDEIAEGIFLFGKE